MLRRVENSPNHKCHAISTGEAGVEDEQKEEFVVSNPHTIVDPWTMMIHFDNATFTYTAVVGPLRFERVAPPA